jgi:alkanesulfonate monooxygenase SsuD/methylene tetrahydromethanopterin reductase-like flavin-dependent oxidoreductase (luciferase family)
MYMMRFDMRVPGKTPEQIAEQYQCAIEMARWVDDKGPFMIGLSEHHAADDGYGPTPLVQASAMAAVTRNVPFMIAATLLPLYEPVRLAEEMIVLDHISKGRVSYVLAIGYRKAEYDLFGLDFSKRGALADEKLAKLLDTLRAAREGQGMPRVTPPPFSANGPTIMWGGGSKPAARRAGRNGLGFVAQVDAPGLEEAYRQAARDAGREPGPCMIPPSEMPNIVFVHPDPDQGWEEVGPYLLADAQSYAEWNREAGLTAASLSHSSSIEEMKTEQGAYRVVTVEGAVELMQKWGRLPLHPLCGGCPPELAWQYLQRVVDEVMPAVAKASEGK